MTQLPWTPEALTELRRLAKLGYTGPQLQFLLNRSRNSIAGKAHRNGISIKRDQTLVTTKIESNPRTASYPTESEDDPVKYSYNRISGGSEDLDSGDDL